MRRLIVDAAPDFASSGQRYIADARGSGRRPQNSAEHAEESSLPGAIGAEDREHFAPCNRDRDVIDGSAIAEFFRKILCRDCRAIRVLHEGERSHSGAPRAKRDNVADYAYQACQ